MAYLAFKVGGLYFLNLFRKIGFQNFIKIFLYCYCILLPICYVLTPFASTPQGNCVKTIFIRWSATRPLRIVESLLIRQLNSLLDLGTIYNTGLVALSFYFFFYGSSELSPFLRPWMLPALAVSISNLRIGIYIIISNLLKFMLMMISKLVRGSKVQSFPVSLVAHGIPLLIWILFRLLFCLMY